MTARPSTRLGLLTVLWAAAAASAQASKPVNILFIGNSFTFGHANPIMTYDASTVTDENHRGYGGIPAVFKQFTVQAGLDYRVTSDTFPNQTLGWHAVNKPDVASRPGWDVVVLQGLSSEPLPASHGGNPANFYEGAAELVKLIRTGSPQAKIYVYETWASPAALKKQGYSNDMVGLAQMQADLHRASFKVAFDQQLTGVLWGGEGIYLATKAGVGNIDPKQIPAGGFDLWDANDHRHASSHGSYLVAASIFETLTGQDPRKLSAGAGTPAAALGISPDEAAILEKWAHETNLTAPPSRIDVTTLKLIDHSTPGASGNPASVTTAEGTFTGLMPLQAQNGLYPIGPSADGSTRFCLLAPQRTWEEAEVELMGADGSRIGAGPLKVTRPPGSDAVGLSFSLSDFGVADLDEVKDGTALRVSDQNWRVSRYQVPAAGAESIDVIGRGRATANGGK